MTIHIAVDIGGTFTDVIAREGDSTFSTKVPTTPGNLVSGVQNGVSEIQPQTTGDRTDVSRFVHGTTAGTNAVLERNGGRIGLLMTEGFRDVLSIGRQKREDMYNLFIDEQTPTYLAPRHRRYGIEERLTKDGETLVELNEADVLSAVEKLVEEHGVDSIGICFLFSFANSDHERRTEELINEHYPEIHVSRSSKVNPKIREYERLVVTAFDAYLRPVIEDYIDRMESMLTEESIDADLQIMQTRGGITYADLILEKPVSTVLSGPAAAVTGAANIGNQSGYTDLITFDMGGTSSDVSLIHDGSPHISSEGELIDYPLRMQMVDITTIGSGGGSIAWLDETQSLHVGPDSAGADPGPACYGRGGSAPTVTDASLVLGYLNPEYFADGSFNLDKGAATEVIREKIADPLGYDVIKAAKGIHNIVNTKLSEQLRLNTVQRGFDPRNFSLFAMGGAGPSQAGFLANSLDIPRVVVPPNPGVLSASGLLSADVEHDHEVTFVGTLDDTDVSVLEAEYEKLDRIGEEAMKAEGTPLDEVNVVREADMRYQGQSFEIDVQLPSELTADSLASIRCRFHERHEQVYGHKNEGDPVEFVNLRVVHTHTPEQLDISHHQASTSIDEARKGERTMYFPDDSESYNGSVYTRNKLPTEERFDGPSVVEQSDTTTVIYPDQIGKIDENGNLIIHAN